MKIEIHLDKKRSYPIYIEDSWEAWPDRLDYHLSKTSFYFLLSDKSLPNYILKNFHKNRSVKIRSTFYLQGGEKTKIFKNLEKAYNQFIQESVDRSSCLFALGGGVVGDFGGFVASTLLRGISFVQIPTSLLSAVDASVGGKVGVNVQYGKNMVGSFYHPRFVYCNTSHFETLPKKEWLCGLAEMFKHALLDERTLEEFYRMFSYLRQPKTKEFKTLLSSSLKVKAQIVEKDEREQGKRATLNLGHTTAHALESITKHKKISHGEAVSRGLVTALILSRNLQNLPDVFVKECLEKLQSLSLPLDTLGLEAKKVYSHMRFDKKNTYGQIHFVLLKKPGEAIWNQEVSQKEFETAWNEQKKLFD